MAFLVILSLKKSQGHSKLPKNVKKNKDPSNRSRRKNKMIQKMIIIIHLKTKKNLKMKHLRVMTNLMKYILNIEREEESNYKRIAKGVELDQGDLRKEEKLKILNEFSQLCIINDLWKDLLSLMMLLTFQI